MARRLMPCRRQEVLIFFSVLLLQSDFADEMREIIARAFFSPFPACVFVTNKEVRLVCVFVCKLFGWDRMRRKWNEGLSDIVDSLKVEIDHGITSTSFWFNELVQVERSLVNAAYKLATISTLIAALDHCRDMIQITDAHHRVQVSVAIKLVYFPFLVPPFVFTCGTVYLFPSLVF